MKEWIMIGLVFVLVLSLGCVSDNNPKDVSPDHNIKIMSRSGGLAGDATLTIYDDGTVIYNGHNRGKEFYKTKRLSSEELEEYHSLALWAYDHIDNCHKEKLPPIYDIWGSTMIEVDGETKTIYSLGVRFTCDNETSDKINQLRSKINALKEELGAS